jgi:hypothetical protein
VTCFFPTQVQQLESKLKIVADKDKHILHLQQLLDSSEKKTIKKDKDLLSALSSKDILNAEVTGLRDKINGAHREAQSLRAQLADANAVAMQHTLSAVHLSEAEARAKDFEFRATRAEADAERTRDAHNEQVRETQTHSCQVFGCVRSLYSLCVRVYVCDLVTTIMFQSRRHQSQLRDLEARIVEAHKETNFYRDELTIAQKRVLYPRKFFG